MKQATFILLCAGLAWAGCSSEDNKEAASGGPKTMPGTGGEGVVGGFGAGENGAKPGGGLAGQTSQAGIVKLDPKDVPVLAERNGRFYQVYEIATNTFSGEVILKYPDGVTHSSEKIYIDGLLTRHTEWHPNKQKKMEVVLQPDGSLKTAHFDEQGKPVNAPVRIVTAVGRGLEWTYGAGNKMRIEIIYKGRSTEIIKKAFGDPDEDQKGVWIYKGMKVKVAQPGSTTGQLMTTVRFVIQNETVLDVSVEP